MEDPYEHANEQGRKNPRKIPIFSINHEQYEIYAHA